MQNVNEKWHNKARRTAMCTKLQPFWITMRLKLFKWCFLSSEFCFTVEMHSRWASHPFLLSFLHLFFHLRCLSFWYRHTAFPFFEPLAFSLPSLPISLLTHFPLLFPLIFSLSFMSELALCSSSFPPFAISITHLALSFDVPARVLSIGEKTRFRLTHIPAKECAGKSKSR